MKKTTLIIINTILCIILCLNQLLLVFINSSKKINIKETVTYFYQNIDTVELLNKADNEKNNILNKIYLKAKEKDISENIVNELLNSNKIKNYFGEHIGSVLENTLNNKQTEEITQEEFNKILDDSIDNTINNISGDKKEKLLNIIKEYSNKIINKINIYQNKIINNKITKLIKILLNEKTTKILIINLIIILLLIILINHSTYKWAIWTGITSFISSLIILLIGIVSALFIKLSNIEIGGIISNSFVILLNDFKNILIKSGLIIFIISLIQIIYYSYFINKYKTYKIIITDKLTKIKENKFKFDMTYTNKKIDNYKSFTKKIKCSDYLNINNYELLKEKNKKINDNYDTTIYYYKKHIKKNIKNKNILIYIDKERIEDILNYLNIDKINDINIIELDSKLKYIRNYKI